MGAKTVVAMIVVVLIALSVTPAVLAHPIGKRPELEKYLQEQLEAARQSAGHVEPGTFGLTIQGPFGSMVYVFPNGQEHIFFGFGGDTAVFDIFTTTTLYDDLCKILAEGGFAGQQLTQVNSLAREIVFFDPGVSTTFSKIGTGTTLAFFEFSGSGTSFYGFKTDDPYDTPTGHVFLNIHNGGDIWIEVFDGILVSRSGPEVSWEPNTPEGTIFQLASVEFPAGGGGAVPEFFILRITLAAYARLAALAETVVTTAGLSYGNNWLCETETFFFQERVTDFTLNPDGTVTFTIAVPSIPAAILNLFAARKAVYTSYKDPDPETDYVDVVLSIAGSRKFHVLVPLSEFGPSLTIKKMATKE